MIKRITIFFLSIILVLLFAISAFALIRPSETAGWKEDILTLLSLVKRVGDYSEVVDLIEVVPALKKDPEIRKAFITFAPPGATPPEWAKEEEITPPVRTEVPEKIAIAEAPKEKERRKGKEEPAPPVIIEIPEKIATAETPEKVGRRESEQVTRERQRTRETEKRRRKEERARAEEARRIAQEVSLQREAAPPEIIKEKPKIEAPKGIEVVTEGPPEKIGIVEEAPAKEAIKEELGAIPTPLPQGAKVIYSIDVVSGVKAEIVEGKTKVTITLSGERKYTVSERSRPPAIVIDIPHTINAVSPERIVVNQGGVRTIEVTQHRALPFDETRIVINLSRFKEYEIKSRENEIYVEFWND